MPRKTLIFGMTLAAAMVAACTSGAASSGGPSAAATLSVDGRTYISTDATGVSLVAGSRVRLSFADGSLNANAGCNSMSGAYTIADDRLRTTEMAMTEMGCAEPLMQQDQWLAALLGNASISLAGDTLTLDDGTVRITLLDREVASPDKPIEGTLWVLDGIVSGDAVSSVPSGVTASIRIADGRVDLDTGCNVGGGTVAVTDGTLAFGPVALTKRACEPGQAAVEAAMASTLSGTVRYTIEADELTLDGGDAGLIFRAGGPT
jgi:heat shock protein HslJ